MTAKEVLIKNNCIVQSESLKILESMYEFSNQSKWINVSDGLPELNQDVIVFKNDKTMKISKFTDYNFMYGFRFPEAWFLRTPNDPFSKKSIIAWQPLPEPYKK